MADPQLFNVGTLGEMSARITRWARERLDPDVVNDAINDAIESLWQSVSLATLSRFISAPVTQEMLANTTSFEVVTIVDPNVVVLTGATPGGELPTRQYTLTFTYVTESGSETAQSPATVVAVPLDQLLVVLAPAPLTTAYGWNLYGGPAGRLVRQNVAPLPFTQYFIEPPFGLNQAPDGQAPPAFNTTADNLAAIKRLDVSNQDGTLSGRRQADLGSSLFTAMQARLPTTITYANQAYDLIDNRVVEFRPSSQYDQTATLYYIVRPRRLRFPNAKLPYYSFASYRFISCFALSDILDSLYEDEAAARWEKKAGEERERITLAVLAENWDKNTRVRSFRA